MILHKALYECFPVCQMPSIEQADMEQKKEKNIYDVSKPLYIISYCFGLACFKIDRNSRVLRTTSLNLCIFAMNLLFWGWSTMLRFNQDYNYQTGARSKLLDKLVSCQFTLQHVFGILVVVYNFMQRKHIEILLKSLDNFDRVFRSLRWRFEPSQSFLKVMVVLTIVGLIMLALHGIELLVEVPLFDGKGAFIYVQFMLFFLVISQQFAISVKFVDIRLSVLTNNFQ